MKNNFDTNAGLEQTEKEPKITLHFFRHGQQNIVSDQVDEELELTEKGREQAVQKSTSFGDERNLNQAVGFGSPRKRSQQTSGFTMTSGILDSITGQESLDELREKIDKDIKVGSKVGVDNRLNYSIDENTPYGKKAMGVAGEGKNYLKFLVEESGKLAKQENDTLSSTYSRQARNIAQIVKKYIEVLGRWGDLVESGKYKDPNLERFLVSHGGVTESFLLKVIEKVKGQDERDRLVGLMNHFDHTEGFDVTLSNKSGVLTTHIAFKREGKNDSEKTFIFDEDVPIDVIDEIIKEGIS